MNFSTSNLSFYEKFTSAENDKYMYTQTYNIMYMLLI